MKPGEWIIFYEDHSMFSHEDGEPFDAPRTAVQAIVQYHRTHDYELVHGRDYFYYEEKRGGWSACDYFGAFDHLCRADRQCLLFGRMLSDEDWRDVIAWVNSVIGSRNAGLAREYGRDREK